MGRLADLLASGRRPLWIEATAYASRLLAGGAVPWLDVAAVVAWHRKAQSLLRSDVVSLPAGLVAQAWYQSDDALAAEMRSKKRVTAPLKILLASDTLRAHLSEIVEGLRASHSDAPLALALPSPRRWVADAYRWAHGVGPEVGEDEADGAAVYVADFLRTFGESGVDLVLLEESVDSVPANAFQLKWYQPVYNTASHYRWECGVRIPVPRDLAGAGGIDFCIAPETIPGLATGVALSQDFWRNRIIPDLPERGFWYLEIPAEAVAETTLELLAMLR